MKGRARNCRHYCWSYVMVWRKKKKKLSMFWIHFGIQRTFNVPSIRINVVIEMKYIYTFSTLFLHSLGVQPFHRKREKKNCQENIYESTISTATFNSIILFRPGSMFIHSYKYICVYVVENKKSTSKMYQQEVNIKID